MLQKPVDYGQDEGQPPVLCIAGGAGDIGCAVATHAMRDGWRVWVIDLVPAIAARLSITEMQVTQRFSPESVLLKQDAQTMVDVCYLALPETTDVQRQAIGMQKAVQCILDHDVSIDALVAASGQLHLAPLSAIGAVKLQACFSSNVYANFFAIQAVLPSMKKRAYGRVVILTSDQAVHGRSLGAAYGMTKAAMLHLTKHLTAELQGEGNIRANAVVLGTVADTRMTESAAQDLAISLNQSMDDMRKQFSDELPTGEMVDLSRAARWILRFCDIDAQDCAGCVMTIDSGLCAVR